MKKVLFFLMFALFCIPWAMRAQQSLPYSYGFENNDLDAAGWTTYFGTSHTGNNGDCGISTGAKKTGDYGFRFSSYYEQGQEAQFLISPELSAASGVLVSFYYASSSSSSSGEKFKVGYSTTDNQVESFTWSQEYSTESTSWSTLEEIFPAGTKYIAIYYYANYQYRLFIDDISLTTPPSCVKPTNLDVTATGLSATFTWASDATQWQVAHATLATAVPDENIVTSSPINTTTYSMEDLALDEDHYFWVRTYCSATDQSEWTGPVSVHIGYCVPTLTSTSTSYYISRFTTTGATTNIDNETTGVGSSYSNFYDTHSATAYSGLIIDFTITIAGGSTHGSAIWVDWNNDMVFSTDERVYSTTGYTSSPHNGSFVVPTTATIGDHRMRIVSDYYTGTPSNPCSANTGEFEDYKLTITEVPSCLPPTALALSRDNDQITATWEGTASSYNIDINGTVTNNVTSPYVFTADLATTYTVKVQTNCGGETSDWSNTQSITTPDCWGGHTIDYTLIDQYDDSWNGASISVIGDCGAYNETLTVASGASPLSGTLNLCGDYYEFIWNKGSYDGECSFTFTEGGTTLFTKPSSVSDGLVLYTIGTQSCPKPTALENEDPEAHSVELSWTESGEATAWQLSINGDEDNLIEVTENPYTLEDLDPETDYSVKVRAKCGLTDVSCWSESVIFTTPVVCPAPTALTAGTPGPNSVELNWKKNGAETAWQISIGDESDLIDVTTSNVQTTHTVINGNLTTFINYTLTGLTAGTDYTVKVRANCGNTDGVSEWSNSENFTTAASCPTPVLVASGITNIAGHTADVAWTGFDQNDSYEVHYRTAEYVDGVEEGFSSNPTGWLFRQGALNADGTATLSGSSSWSRGTNCGVFDSHISMNMYSTKNYWLITPSMTINNGDALSFDLAYTKYSNTSTNDAPVLNCPTHRFAVLISTDDMATWTILREWNNSGSEYVLDEVPQTGENSGTIDLSAYNGATAYIAFFGHSETNSFDNNFHFDNVTIGTPVAAGAWQTENVAAPATSTTLANLDPETTYEVYVTGHCATGDVTTDPSATQTFKTTVACIAPTGLEVTANGVDATFTWESEAGSYEIARATTSNANPNEFVVGTADEESYAMNDLDLGDYYLWVRANCDGEDNSTWSGPVSLHIGYCLPNPSSRDGKGITKVVFGTGENIVNNVDETNGLPSSAPYYGDYSAMVGAVPAGTEATIDITYNTCTSSCFNYGTLIWVDWDNSLTFEDDELVFVGQSSTATNPSGAHTLSATFTVPVDQALGNYRMRIAGADSYFDSYINGNATAYHSACFSHDYTVCHDYTLQVLEAPSCFAPTDLAVTYEGGTEATVSWTSEATAWNIDVNGTVTAITENPYTLSGLELATNYAVKVQAVCDVATSEWTNPANFSTDLCLPENQCELTFVLTDSYGDGWNGNKIVVTDVATGKVLGELTNENLDGVTQQREENVKTLSVCNGREIQFSWVSGNYPSETSYTVYDLNGNEIFSGSGVMSAPVNYTVNCASCAPVTELEASVNGFDVTLTWEPGGSETDWAIRYREEGTADWNEDINDGSEYEIAGLLPGDYEAEVRALCGSSVTSGWTSTTFTVECPNYSGEETVSICADNYEWNGTNYTTSGDKQKHFTLANGCDSLATLHLTLKSPSAFSDVTTVCANEFPTTFHGVQFSQAGTQTFTIPNSVNCDSVVTLTVNVKQPTSFSDVTTICSNELPYTFHDVLFTAAGTQTKTLTNAVGCDSVVTLTVNVKQTSSFSDEITICDDELPFEFHGVTFQEAGTNNRTLTNAVDCDSVVTLTVNVKYRSYFSDEISVCAADMPYTFHGVQFTVAGTQTKTIPNAAGCDSIMTLTVNVKQPSSFTDTWTVCAEDMPVDWYGHLFTQAGTQTFHNTNAVGCDSTSTLTLYVNTPVHQSYTVDACDSYKWVVGSWSQTYTTPGVKLHSHSDANGCTQVDTLHLTLRHSTTGIDEVTACNSYTWINGTTYTQSTNTPTYTLTNAAGCDSVVTLHLTVNHSRPVSYTITECDSYTWIDGITYNASTTATYSHEDVHGCTQVDTLYLTINYSATKDLYDTVCEGKPYYLNGFIIPGSENVEGDHTHTLNLFTINQCDSTVTLHLHVNICDETCGQPITDIDNNSYETMPVHRLCWMTSNLRTTRYSDGTTIPFAIVYSYPYDPNNTDNLMTFGRLYNWTSASKAAAATPLQGVCPDGWRLPTQAEFEELSTFYTETQLRSTANWIQGAGTNASGFNKQPGGFYNGTTGICERLGASAHFYTADTQANGVIYQISDYSCDSVTYDVTDNPQDGRSIRCVRDLGND